MNKLNKAEEALACFEQGFSWSQAVLSTYGPRFGLDRETALKVAGAFGGGMGRMGETCGAVTGAFMVIGMKHGMARKGDDKERDTTYKLVERFVREFNARNATVICRELLGCDISTSEGMKKIKKENLFRTRCPKFVQDAAEILEEMLEP